MLSDRKEADGLHNPSAFCPELTELLSKRRVVGRSGKVFDNLTALSTANSLSALASLMDELRPPRTLEVGMCFGGSALLFAAAHRRHGRPASGQHTVFDPYQSTVWDDTGLMVVERAGLMEYLDFRPERSCIGLPRLLDEGAQFHLIYIDGSHLFEDVFVDAYFAARLLPLGGIIAFDDSRDSAR